MSFLFQEQRTPEQETQLAEVLNSDKSAYDWMKNNCVSPSQNALNDLGFDVGEDFLPYDYGTALDQSNLVQSYNMYKNVAPQGIEDGFSTVNNVIMSVSLAINAALGIRAAQAAASVGPACVGLVTKQGIQWLDGIVPAVIPFP